MTAHTLPTASPVRKVAPPASVRARSTLPLLDYADTFVVRTGRLDDRRPEDLARLVLEGAPDPVRRQLQLGWRAIGLRLGRGGGTVLGWPIRESTPDHVLLAAGSFIGMPAQLLFERAEGALVFATFVQRRTPLARLAWAAIEPVHAPTVRRLLERAARELAP